MRHVSRQPSSLRCGRLSLALACSGVCGARGTSCPRGQRLLLGHEKLETTQIYAQVSIRMLKEVHTRTHPARLSLGSAAAGAAALDDGSDEHADDNLELAAELAADEAELAEGDLPT